MPWNTNFYIGRPTCLNHEAYLFIFLRSNWFLYLFLLRQLATATRGMPLFEVFFTVNDEGEYKQQVYIKIVVNFVGWIATFIWSLTY